MTRPVYVPAIGQHDNIGDIILRRPLLDVLRPIGPLHVYVGRAPAGYIAGLRIRPGDRLYQSFVKWYVRAAWDALRTGIFYAFKPGEIQMTLPGLKEHVSILPVLALSRLRGGKAVRVGVGSRNFSPRFRPLFMPSVRLSDLSLWRDEGTRDFVDTGGVMPDLAFGEGSSLTPSSTSRRVLVISMRSDRPYPGPDWLEGVRAFAAEHGLEICAVTQVLRDDQRTRELAADLGGTVLPWDGTEHEVQEERLRELYRRTAVAVSDRLHVLIAAFTEGASPVALLVDDSDKIRRHFDAAGVHGVTIACADRSAPQVTDAISQVVGDRADLDGALAHVRDRLSRNLELVNDTFGLPGARPSEVSVGVA